MDLPVAPTAMIDLLRAWFFAKDRSIVLAINTCLISDTFLCFQTGIPHTERMRITEDGDVGIGTIIPGASLTVIRRSGVGTIQLDGDAGQQINLEWLDGGIKKWAWYKQPSNRISLFNFNLGSNALTILPNGNFGVNRGNPANAKCHIDQSSTTAAIPTLIVDQADISEGTINFVASARGTGSTAASDIQDTVRVELNNVVYRLALYTDA